MSRSDDDLKFGKIWQAVFLFLIVLWIGDKCAMANDMDGGVRKLGGFSLSWSGGLEYGSRQMSFDGEDRFYFAKGDTINDDAQTGVGVFVLNLQNRDVEALKEVAKTLCDKDIQTGGPETYDPPAAFNVICLDDGKAVGKSGSLRLIPEKFRKKIFDVPLKLSERAWTEGAKLIKLDFSPYKVEHNKDGFVVSVRFTNSGNRWIKFKTPDQWGGTSTDGRLGTGAIGKYNKNGMREDVKQSWGFALGGQKLLNRDEFQDGVVLLNPGDSKVLKFKTKPDYQASAGEYEFSGIAFMRIEYEGYGWGLSSQVDFGPVNSRITIDRDYPSTPQEREQWEKTHRENMSQWPVKPGQTFAEDGLYRAVRTSGNYRGLFLKHFKAGDVASAEKVKMPMDGERLDGLEIDGPVQWLWTASAPTPVRQWSSELIDGTQQFCKPGVACPRSGRWVPQVSVGYSMSSQETRYQLAGMVTLRRGEPMPSIEGQYPQWEWVGVAHG